MTAPFVPLVAVLALHVGLADDAVVRLASTGTGDEVVTWTLDGDDVAWTDDGHAAQVTVAKGEHALWATSASTSAWRVLARVDAPGDGQAKYVAAWTASHPAEPRAPLPLLPLGLAGLGLLVASGKLRSLLQAVRRRPPA